MYFHYTIYPLYENILKFSTLTPIFDPKVELFIIVKYKKFVLI